MPNVKPIPDNYPQLIPYLCVDGASEAIAFYTKVLGATEEVRMPGPDNTIGHCEMRIGDSMFMLSDEMPDMGNRSPRSIGGSPVTIGLYVDDADRLFADATGAGAKELRPLENQFYGDRAGLFEDPWGHRWNIMTHVEDVSPDEMQRRMADLFPQSAS